MTTKGKLFKSYAEAIVKTHGFGSNKMVKHWSTGFFMEQKDEIGKLIAGKAEDSDEMKQGMARFEELWNGEDELIKDGYLRKYQPEWYGWRNRRYGKHYGSVYIGLTEKGWAVAKRYMECEA